MRVAVLLCSGMPLLLPYDVVVQMYSDLLLLDAGVVEIDPTYAWSMQVSCNFYALFICLSCALGCVLCMEVHWSV